MSDAHSEIVAAIRLLSRVKSYLAYIDPSLRYVYVNAAYERWFGAETSGLAGHYVRDVLDAELYASSEPFLLAALGGFPQHFERQFLAANGGSEFLVHYLPDIEDGVVRGVVVEIIDVTMLRGRR